MLQQSVFRFLSVRYLTFIVFGVLAFGVGLLPFSRSIALAVGTPPAPTVVSPADGSLIVPDNTSGGVSFPPVALPELEWSVVDGTVNYRLQIANNIGFSPIAFEVTTPNTTYTPISVVPFADGTWYWRVRVDSPIPSDYSFPVTFIKQWATISNTPNLVHPADGATLKFIDYNNPTVTLKAFVWEPVVGAAQYRLEIDNSPDFTTLVYSATSLVTTHQPTTKFANGVYYWRVIPIDIGNRSGTVSEARTFTMGYSEVPLLIEPADNSFPLFTPTFRWTAVEGAQLYRLQYSTDPTFNTGVTQVDTRNTTYTPISTLANDVNYYWRVKVISGVSDSDWSVVFSFLKQWYLPWTNPGQNLLAPTNNYQYNRLPNFYWTPTPGAARYLIEIDKNNDFVQLYLSAFIVNTSYTPNVWDGTFNGPWYWRVTPYDGSGTPGKVSEVFSFLSSPTNIAPELINPLYYYVPDSLLNPAENRAIPFPSFTWHRVIDPVSGGTLPNAYRIQVSSDPLFISVDWEFETETLNAVPTSTDLFSPLEHVNYYWRVCPLSALGSGCLLTYGNPSWSQRWVVQFDSSLGIPPTTGDSPELLNPMNGFESTEYTPRLDWKPYQGADSYEVQISDDINFTQILDSATVPYSSYAPQDALVERHLTRVDYGTFYWRVRALSGGNPSSNWSDTWRFQIGSQSMWFRDRTLGDAIDFKIGDDPDDQTDNNFELTNLYSTQDASFWYFGFDATSMATNMTYAIYMDQDYQDNSGGTADARGYDITTINFHRPEYILYVFQIGNNFSAANTALYAWTGSGWAAPSTLADVGGSLSFVSGSPGYLEVRVPNTAIGFDEDNGSYNIAVLSLPGTSVGSNSPPSDVTPDIAGATSSLIDRFSVVSDRPQLVFPFNNLGGDPTTYPSVLPFSYEYPTGYYTTLFSPSSFWGTPRVFRDEQPFEDLPKEILEAGGTALSPWSGGTIEVYLDPQFTTIVGTFSLICNCNYYNWQTVASANDLQGDNSYYWRFRARYLDNFGPLFGPWSEGFRFERAGFVPENLNISVNFATPTFSWDKVEGTEKYNIQVDNDPAFASPDLNIDTTQNSYTPTSTLDKGLYYWRVRVKRNGNIINDWSPTQSFNLTLPTPDGLEYFDPDPDGDVSRTPTLCWDSLLVSNSNQEPVLAAWKYRVQMSTDPTFSAVSFSIDTEQHCYTPVAGYADATYYWRVAMIDGSSRLGDYASGPIFTKQYPVTTLIAPLDGGQSLTTPTFIWTDVDGAASYRLEVSTSPTFTPAYDSITTHNIRFTPTKLYATNLYYWRVAIIDKDGKMGPFTDAVIIIDPSGFGYKSYLPIIIR